MAAVLRGDIYWADLDSVRGREQAGRRPVLVLSHELFNRKSSTAIVMAVTSSPQRAGFPLSVALPAQKLPKSSWIKVSQIRTISVDGLGTRISHLEDEQLAVVVEGLLELIS